MAFLIVLVRAALLLVVLPIVAYAAVEILLPGIGFIVPVSGLFNFSHLAAAVAFLVGFLVFAQRPTGKDSDADFGPDFENEE